MQGEGEGGQAAGREGEGVERAAGVVCLAVRCMGSRASASPAGRFVRSSQVTITTQCKTQCVGSKAVVCNRQALATGSRKCELIAAKATVL